MDVELATVSAERVDAWIETARQHAHNEEYYRGLLDRIGERVGPSAYVSDDGSVQDSVLRAKVPELVSALLEAGREGDTMTTEQAAELILVLRDIAGVLRWLVVWVAIGSLCALIRRLR